MDGSAKEKVRGNRKRQRERNQPASGPADELVADARTRVPRLSRIESVFLNIPYDDAS
jgi:hypothetical protein